MMGDGMGADVHAGRDLLVVKSLRDQSGDGLLGAGQAVPSGDRPSGGRRPVAAADAEFAKPSPDTSLVTVGSDLAVSTECRLQVSDRLLPVLSPDMQGAE